MTLRDILNTVFKRKWIVVAFFAAAVAGAYAGLRIYPPDYEASARLLVKIGQEDIYMPTLTTSEFRAPLASVVREEQVNSEIQILSSDGVLGRVVDRMTPQGLFPGIDTRHPWYTPKGLVQRAIDGYRGIEAHFFPLAQGESLRDKAIRNLRDDLAAVGVKDSGVIAVSLRSRAPEISAAGVNAVLETYLAERTRVHVREQAGFYEQRLAEVDGRLKAAEAALETFRSERGVVDAERQRDLLLERLAEVRGRIQDLTVAAAETAEREAELLRQLEAVAPRIALSQASNGMALSEVNKQLTELMRREAEISSRFNDNDPRLVAVRAEMASVRRQLGAGAALTTREEGVNPLHVSLTDEIVHSRADLASRREALRNWATVEGQVLAALDEINTGEAQLLRLEQDRKVLQDSRQLYLEKIQEAQYTAASAEAALGNVSVISWAVPEPKPVSPKLWMVLLATLVGGLFGGIGLAFLFEMLDDSVKTDREAAALAGAPVLGKIQYLRL